MDGFSIRFSSYPKLSFLTVFQQLGVARPRRRRWPLEFLVVSKPFLERFFIVSSLWPPLPLAPLKPTPACARLSWFPNGSPYRRPPSQLCPSGVQTPVFEVQVFHSFRAPFFSSFPAGFGRRFLSSPIFFHRFQRSVFFTVSRPPWSKVTQKLETIKKNALAVSKAH